jgi:hypothetical protein
LSQPGRRPLETREAVLIAFFAAFLVAARAAMRWHLNIPGHAMVGAAFGLVLVRSCVDRRVAASTCGLLAGVACAALGMGRGGPLIALKLALPGVLVDLGMLRVGPRSVPSLPRGAWVGAMAGLSTLAPLVVVEWLTDVEPGVIGLHALTSGAGKALFGALGGAAGAWVARELRHHGLLEARPH